jgi:hypothetical protein
MSGTVEDEILQLDEEDRDAEDDDEDEVFMVKAVLDMDRAAADKNTWLYKVRWDGYDSNADTWEPASSFASPVVFEQLHRQLEEVMRRASVGE